MKKKFIYMTLGKIFIQVFFLYLIYYFKVRSTPKTFFYPFKKKKKKLLYLNFDYSYFMLICSVYRLSRVCVESLAVIFSQNMRNYSVWSPYVALHILTSWCVPPYFFLFYFKAKRPNEPVIKSKNHTKKVNFIPHVKLN